MAVENFSSTELAVHEIWVCQWIYHHYTKRPMVLASRGGHPFVLHPLLLYEHYVFSSSFVPLELNISLRIFSFSFSP
jgi:hypothetical protein